MGWGGVGWEQMGAGTGLSRPTRLCDMLSVDLAYLLLSPRALRLRKWPLSPR